MSKPARDFQVGVIVLAHRRPTQLATLLGALRHPRVSVYLHLDRRSDIEPFQAALADAEVGDITWLRRYRSSWGSVQIVDAELDGMARALADGCSYMLLISGEDFPLKPIAEIVEFIEANQARSYVAAVPLPYAEWELQGRGRTDFYSYRLFGQMYMCIPPGESTTHLARGRRALNWALRARSALRPVRRFPAYLTPFGGQQWFNLSAAAAADVLGFAARHPDYRRYHAHTIFADELFIHSILLGSEIAADHEIVDDDLRFLIWDGGDHPKTLTLKDLPAMTVSDDLFARKINGDEHPELLAELCERSRSVHVRG